MVPLSDSLQQAIHRLDSTYTAAAQRSITDTLAHPMKSAPYTFLEHPFIMTLVVCLLLLWLLREPLRQYYVRRAALAAAPAGVVVPVASELPATVPATADLTNVHEHLLNLLRQRDRLLVELVAMKGPLIPVAVYQQWEKRTWKAYALNRLALVRAVRPLVYADYRGCILCMSPTLGILPGPAMLSLAAASAALVAHVPHGADALAAYLSNHKVVPTDELFELFGE